MNAYSPHIIIDSAIPFIKGVLDDCASVEYLHSTEIDSAHVRDADALIVRTRTRCSRTLLDASRVRCIATATIGEDHIDAVYLKANNIAWASAPGCNARSVAQYVAAAIDYAQIDITKATFGVIGCGHVGSEVVKILNECGARVLRCDPLINDPSTVGLNTIMQQCDVITLHTPLTFDTPHATHKMIADEEFALCTRRPLIINAARGGIVDEAALLNAMAKGIVSGCVIDCWEGEPHINEHLLSAALLATPHIAGYSADGKWNATSTAVDFIAQRLVLRPHPIEPLEQTDAISVAPRNVLRAIHQAYAIERDSIALKNRPSDFELLRNNYPVRRELNYTIK